MAVINIAENKNYKWTATTGTYLDRVPRIFVKSFEPKNNDILQSVGSWLASIKPNVNYKEFYSNLHKTGKPKDDWTFPFFEDTVRSFTNEWGDNRIDSTNPSRMTGLLSEYADQNVATAIAAGTASITELVTMFQSAVGDGKINAMLLEPPKFYQYGVSDSDITIQFPLINTLEDSNPDSHHALIRKLISENRFERLGGAGTASPYLWSVVIPGYRAIPWASCSVDVNLVGNRFYVSGRLEPEGYIVKLTFKSLYTEPRNFMNDTDKFLNSPNW